MADVESLISRINNEFSVAEERIKKEQAEHLKEHHERQQRLAEFQKLLDKLPTYWRPRLEALIKRFGEKVKVTPQLSSSSRQAVLDFKSDLAHVKLRLSATTDPDVRFLVLDYNLEILPILMEFESHQQAKWPLDKIDPQAIADWIDDRIISFVKVYLSLQDNHYYLKDHMVEDPIAKVTFPKFAAGATLDWQGKTYYFIAEETRSEFQTKNGVRPE